MGDSSCPNSARLQVLIDEHRLLDIDEAFQQHPELALSTLTHAFVFSSLSPNSLDSIQLLSTFGCAIRARRPRAPYRLQALYGGCVDNSLEEGCIEQRFYQHGGLHALAALCAAASDNKQTRHLLDNLSEGEIKDLVNTINKIEPHDDLRFITESLKRGKTQRPSKKRTTKQLKIPGRRQPPSRSTDAIPSAEVTQGDYTLPTWAGDTSEDSRLFDYPPEDINTWPELSPLSIDLFNQAPCTVTEATQRSSPRC